MGYFEDKLKAYEGKDFLLTENHSNSYGDLLKSIGWWQNKINDFGIVSGDTVALIGNYSLSSIAVFFALSKIKTIIVPITTRVEEEINVRLNESHAQFYINTESGAITSLKKSRWEHPLIDGLRKNDRAGLILFTSGSSGKPKAMIHDLDNLFISYEGRREKNLIMMVFLMFDHIGGLNTLLNAVSIGASLVIPGERNPELVAKLIERYKVQVLPTSPTFLNLLLLSESSNKHNLSSLRIISYGTEPMPESLLKRLRAYFPKVKFIQTYGTSETGISSTVSEASDSILLKIDDPNTEIKIVNGELWLQSKTQTLGYLNASMDSFTEDGWFRTGDQVEISADGFMKILGRKREVINVGGQKVLPSEVESVLLELDFIQDCIVNGEPNAITGQTVVANVVLKNPMEANELRKAIRRHCLSKLDSYKVPTKIKVMESLNISERFKKTRIE